MSEEFSGDEIEQARKLFAGSCEFIAGAASLDRLPPADLQEIAFVGRSNVGKSSLVNALTGRKALARVSHTPGRTQQLNFFNLGNLLYLVDLPGYGYAKVSKTQKEDWQALIRDYLRGRPTLRCVFLLVDSRHGLKDSDLETMALLDEAAVSYRIIMTKGDKTGAAARAEQEKTILAELKTHGAAAHDIHFTSAHETEGIAQLRALIWRFTLQ